jgi:hypothetical protein
VLYEQEKYISLQAMPKLAQNRRAMFFNYMDDKSDVGAGYSGELKKTEEETRCLKIFYMFVRQHEGRRIERDPA